MQSWIKINTNTVIHHLFLYFNNLHVLRKSDWEKFRSTSHKDADLFLFKKNSDLHLKKDANQFCIEKKFRSTSYKDADLFCLKKQKKIRSTSYKDTDQFFLKKNLDLHLTKMQIYFVLRKNSDPHLIKMQICFVLRKNSVLHLIKMQIYFVLRKLIIHMQIYWHSRKRL